MFIHYDELLRSAKLLGIRAGEKADVKTPIPPPGVNKYRTLEFRTAFVNGWILGIM